MQPLASQTFESPLGTLTLVASVRGIVAVTWPNERAGRVVFDSTPQARAHVLLKRTAEQLAEYFAGGRDIFDVPLDLRGTPFQLRVWQALRLIPFGETRSYGELASTLGDPHLTRAVGAANGRNPVSIVAPCHRVVGADGSLTGFAGGMAAKAHLLRLESRAGRLF